MDVQLDGELIAWNEEGLPDFHRLGRRMLHRAHSVPVSYMVFDVLARRRADQSALRKHS